MNMSRNHSALVIGMLLFPDLTQLDLTGPYEVFARMPATTVHLLAETLHPVRSEHGLTITPDATWASSPPLDVIFVPGGVGVTAMMEHAALLKFLHQQSTSAAYLTAVCTGTLVLGAAGLLHGYRAATHWLSRDLLPLFGAQPVDERVVVDRNRITGGGVTAGIDFGLHVAAVLRDERTAQEIQLMMEYNPQPPFHSGSPTTADPSLVQYVRRASIFKRTVARLSSGMRQIFNVSDQHKPHRDKKCPDRQMIRSNLFQIEVQLWR